MTVSEEQIKSGNGSNFVRPRSTVASLSGPKQIPAGRHMKWRTPSAGVTASVKVLFRKERQVLLLHALGDVPSG